MSPARDVNWTIPLAASRCTKIKTGNCKSLHCPRCPNVCFRSSRRSRFRDSDTEVFSSKHQTRNQKTNNLRNKVCRHRAGSSRLLHLDIFGQGQVLRIEEMHLSGATFSGRPQHNDPKAPFPPFKAPLGLYKDSEWVFKAFLRGERWKPVSPRRG